VAAFVAAGVACRRLNAFFYLRLSGDSDDNDDSSDDKVVSDTDTKGVTPMAVDVVSSPVTGDPVTGSADVVVNIVDAPSPSPSPSPSPVPVPVMKSASRDVDIVRGAATRSSLPGVVSVVDGVFGWSVPPATGGVVANDDGESEHGDDGGAAAAPRQGAKAFRLRAVTLSAQPGALVAVVGRVGAGKTTLLHGLLGETTRFGGSVAVAGSVSYAAQSPWLLADTVRGNILFGSPWDANWYASVLTACGLWKDLMGMPGGRRDLTVVGERGVTLSGGQRARISLARCAYARSDIVILDDPLVRCIHSSTHSLHWCARVTAARLRAFTFLLCSAPAHLMVDLCLHVCTTVGARR
jgi:ABC-type iron transport system FetAB ATPase subunit